LKQDVYLGEAFFTYPRKVRAATCAITDWQEIRMDATTHIHSGSQWKGERAEAHCPQLRCEEWCFPHLVAGSPEYAYSLNLVLKGTFVTLKKVICVNVDISKWKLLIHDHACNIDTAQDYQLVKDTSTIWNTVKGHQLLLHLLNATCCFENTAKENIINDFSPPVILPNTSDNTNTCREPQCVE